MTASVKTILAQIDQLDEAGKEELREALRLRARAEWERLADAERAKSVTEGVTDKDVERAVNDIRYGKKAS